MRYFAVSIERRRLHERKGEFLQGVAVARRGPCAKSVDRLRMRSTGLRFTVPAGAVRRHACAELVQRARVDRPEIAEMGVRQPGHAVAREESGTARAPVDQAIQRDIHGHHAAHRATDARRRSKLLIVSERSVPASSNFGSS